MPSEYIPVSANFPPDKRCPIDGCTKPQFRRGLCMTHYRKQKLYGDVNAPRRFYRRKPCPARPIVYLDDHALVPLTKGLFAKVDVEDASEIGRYSWVASEVSDNYYFAQASIHRKVVTMHRYLLGAPAGSTVDHINRDTLDNRRSNLRLATRKEQSHNKASRLGEIPYKGVGKQPRCVRYMARIVVNGERLMLGLFDTPEEAARAYDDAAIVHFGAFACTNEGLGLIPPRPTNPQ